MNVIIVTINQSDDWNYHNKLANSLNNYDFKLIYKKGIYEIVFDKKYYLLVNENIIIPIKEDEEDKLGIKFVVYSNKAVMHIYLNNQIVVYYSFKVVNELSIDDYINVYI